MRRDDVQTLNFVASFFLLGRLSWVPSCDAYGIVANATTG